VRQPEGGQVDERAAPQILDARDTRALSERREIGRGHVGREAFNAVVRGVAAQQQRRACRERALEISQVDLIGRPDLDEGRAAARQDVGQPEAAADLDELVARNDDFATLRERVEDQEDGGRAVVHD